MGSPSEDATTATTGAVVPLRAVATDVPLRAVAPEASLSSRDDDDLMLLARNEPAAFDVLVRRHQSMVLRLCARAVGDRELACDVAQATFVELHRSLPRYDARGRFRPFLWRIAMNQCRMAGRRRTAERRRELRAVSADATALPDDVAIAAERQLALGRALQTLSSKLKDVVVLRYTADLSHDEIARVLGLPVGTVKSRLFAGLAKLRELLAQEPP